MMTMSGINNKHIHAASTRAFALSKESAEVLTAAAQEVVHSYQDLQLDYFLSLNICHCDKTF
jgi:hypothetical protein